MGKRPIIGIPTQTLEEIPDQLPRCWVMSQQYVRVLVAAGAVPWIIPLLEGDPASLRAIYERVDGIFLPGGVDLDPSAYCEGPSRLVGRTDPARDEIELTLTRWALDDHKPLLAVCRGIQVVNVAAGGSVHQLRALLGAPVVKVNSMHHQGIKSLAVGLRPTAFAPDGLIEGLESPNGHFLLGVQWHPEALVERDPRMQRLFAAFIEAAQPR
jgi:putative glutamine amidotransferase